MTRFVVDYRESNSGVVLALSDMENVEVRMEYLPLLGALDTAETAQLRVSAAHQARAWSTARSGAEREQALHHVAFDHAPLSMEECLRELIKRQGHVTNVRCGRASATSRVPD